MELPLPDKSIDITVSSRALEPNEGYLTETLVELFRVTREKLVLFEPFYERNTPEGRQRMDSHRYVKGIESTVIELGGNIIDRIKIENSINPLNPTFCFAISPPAGPKIMNKYPIDFSVPGTSLPLKKVDDFFFSRDTGLCYPILREIPIFNSKNAILATSLVDL